MPREELSGWLDTVATWNPVTYLLEGMRSLVMEGWEGEDLGAALVAIAVVGAVSMTLCFGALRAAFAAAEGSRSTADSYPAGSHRESL